MKKYLLSLIIIAITSITAFSRTSCEVYGQDGTKVELEQVIGSADKQFGSLNINVKLTKPAEGEVRVSVGVYDLNGCKVTNAPLITIENKKYRGQAHVSGLDKGVTYQFKINSASCQH